VTMDFELDNEVAELARRTRKFVETECYPREADGFDDLGVKPEVRVELQELARQEGIFAPRVPRELGGQGLDMRGAAVVFEEAGRSLLGPQALNAASPEDGNITLLMAVADAEQRRRFLEPMARGELRSCFSMTEPPPGAGSDPTMLQTVATPVDGGWRIDGRKWFTTGAIGAAYAIVMARTADHVTHRGGATMFLVDLDNPGVEIVRPIRTSDRAAVGGHAEIVYDECVVSDGAVLGEVHEGFRYAQVRLVPARLTHCMRWLGLAQRAHESVIVHAGGREAFGSRLGDLGMAQAMIADNEIDLQASRMLIWRAAAELDAGRSARQESAIAKVFVSEATFRVIDRCVQLRGGMGVAEDTGLARFLAEVRPFRIYDGPSEVHRMAIAKRLVNEATR
jgi:acyl-CoA dehydrogenase